MIKKVHIALREPPTKAACRACPSDATRARRAARRNRPRRRASRAIPGIGGRFSELILGIASANVLLAMLFADLVGFGIGVPILALAAPGQARQGVIRPPVYNHVEARCRVTARALLLRAQTRRS